MSKLRGFFFGKEIFMTTDEKNRLKQYFDKLLESIEDGEIHVVPLEDRTAEKDGDDDEV